MVVADPVAVAAAAKAHDLRPQLVRGRQMKLVLARHHRQITAH